MTTSFIIENDIAFREALKRLGEATNDFRIPFGLIAANWYKGNRQIFTLRGPGKYTDFIHDGKERAGNEVTPYMRVKKRFPNAKGSAYPLLLGKTGALAKSILDATDPNTVREISKMEMTLGTKVEHAIYHQSDKPRKSNLPQRKMIFISGGPKETAVDASAGGRLFTWIRIIDDHIKAVISRRKK